MTDIETPAETSPTQQMEVIDLTDASAEGPSSRSTAADRPAGRSLMARVFRPDAGEALVSIMSGVALAWMLREIFGWGGILGTAIWAYVFFLVTYFLLQRSGASRNIAVDRVVSVLIWSAAAAVIAVLGWMILYVVARGGHLLKPSFFTQDMSKTGPLNPGGGVRAAIVGTAEQVGLAIIVVVPVSVLTAVYLNEIKGRLAPVVRFIVNAQAGLPSVVAGLLVYTVWVDTGHGFSGVAGSAALVILMLPSVTRTSEEVLRTVPDPLREASLALGAPHWRVVSRIVLRTGLPGLTTAVILGTALGAGETAPLLLTTSYANNTVTNPLHGPQASLPFFIKTYVLQPVKVQVDRGMGAALVLLILILALFVLARYAGSRSARRLGRR